MKMTEMFIYFKNHFGFTEAETTTLMGAHTMGVMAKVGASCGWVSFLLLPLLFDFFFAMYSTYLLRTGIVTADLAMATNRLSLIGT